MTFDTTGLLATLAAPRPDETALIVHKVTLRIYPHGYAADCACGQGVESLGRDESSRNAIKAFEIAHTNRSES